jgi:UPF0271 protein
VAGAVARATRAVDRSLGFLAPARSELIAAGEAAGIPSFQEIYADRGYTEAGQLIPRGQPGAMILDPEQAAVRVIDMIKAGAIITAKGTHLKTPVHSICVHGDSVHAVETARLIRTRLEQAGIALKQFGTSNAR